MPSISPSSGESRIKVLSLRLAVAGGQSPPKLEKRDWRLLALLIWRAHRAAQSGEPETPMLRHALERPLGIDGQLAFRNALSGVRRLLRSVEMEDSLVALDDTVALTKVDDLDCDLAVLLAAVRREDSGAVARVLQTSGYGSAGLELMRRNLRPKDVCRRQHAAWIDELVDEILARAPVDGRERAESLPALPPLTEATRAYLACHIERCSTIDPRRMPRTAATQDVRLPLDDVYISLLVGPHDASEVTADRDITVGDAGAGEISVADGEARETLLVFQEARPDIHFTTLMRTRRWSVVLGKPGMGKTTLLHWLALFNAKSLLTPGQTRVVVSGEQLGVDEDDVDLGPARLPILVRVADYAAMARDGDPDSLPELIDFLGLHPVVDQPLSVDGKVAAGVIRQWLEADQALVLLDGLDEVPDGALRAGIVQRVERFVGDYVKDPRAPEAFQPWVSGGDWWMVRASEPASTGGNQIVVTSREHGYKQAPLPRPFEVVQARPLDLPAIKRFCNRWTLAVERFRAFGRGRPNDPDISQRADADSSRLIEAVESHPNLRELAGNPLLLTALAMLQHESESLPTTRLEIYGRITRVLVERRHLEWRYEEVVDVLGPLALWLQEERAQGHANIEQLRDRLRIGIQRVASRDVEDQIDEFVEAAQRQSGLLVEVGTGLFGFMHGTFREYFAAAELARKADAFHAWLMEHIHVARWMEVALLGVASVAKHHPEAFDDLLADVLDEEQDIEALLHHDLLFVAACLIESVRASPELTERVVGELLEAGRMARYRGVSGLKERTEDSLGALLRVRGRVVRPILISALADPAHAPVATDVLADDPVASIELLEGLDLACHAPDRSPQAAVARAAVATELHRKGESIPEEMLPVGGLFRPGCRYEAAFAHLSACAPTVGQSLGELADRVQPLLRGLVQWTLALVHERPDLCESPDALVARIRSRAVELLASAQGADFSAVARFALEIDRVGTRDWLLKHIDDAEIDAASAARYLASHPDVLPDASDLTGWLEGLGPRCVTELIRQSAPGLRWALIDVAWRSLRLGLDSDAGREAARLLTAEAANKGYLPASSIAMAALGELLRSVELDARQLGEVLLATVGLDRACGPKLEQLTALFEEIVRAPQDPRARAAALMLAQIPGRELETDQYNLIADALAADDALRSRALAVLSGLRPAEAVSDELLELAWRHGEKSLENNDSAAAEIHFGLGGRLVHTKPDRLLGTIEARRKWSGQGRPTSAVAEEILKRIPDLDESCARAAIHVCRERLRETSLIGVSLPRLEALCLDTLDGITRVGVATLVAGEAVLSSRIEDFASFLVKLADVDRRAAAQGLRTAAHCLPSAMLASHASASEVLRASGEICFPIGEADPPCWVGAGALLAVDVLGQSTPEDALRRLSDRASQQEAAKAIIFALETDHVLPTATPELPLGSEQLGLVTRRLSTVAAGFAASPRGMRALVDTGIGGLDGDWPRRRACLLAMDAAAAASPAQFLTVAHDTDLRERLPLAGTDHTSFSARRLAISLLSRFRILDQKALDGIASASRDSTIVSSTTIDRCRTFDSQEELDLSSLLGLLASRNPHTVEAGTILVANMARSAPPTRVGQRQHQRAAAVLAAVASSSDPLLDCFGNRGRTLRQILHERLVVLVWEGTLVRGAPDSALGRTATGLAWDTNELVASRSRGSHRGVTGLVEALRKVARRNWRVEPRDELRLPKWNLSPEALGFECLGSEQAHLLRIALREELEMRVGIDLADEMTRAQMDEFEEFFVAKDNKGAFEWLKSNLPDYGNTVNRRAGEVRSDIIGSAGVLRNLLDELTSGDN